jgi:hypothetical protein
VVPAYTLRTCCAGPCRGCPCSILDQLTGDACGGARRSEPAAVPPARGVGGAVPRCPGKLLRPGSSLLDRGSSHEQPPSDARTAPTHPPTTPHESACRPLPRWQPRQPIWTEFKKDHRTAPLPPTDEQAGWRRPRLVSCRRSTPPAGLFGTCRPATQAAELPGHRSLTWCARDTASLVRWAGTRVQGSPPSAG